MKTSKYAAYGKLLADRLRFKNPPTLIVVEVGGWDSWQRAKNWQHHTNFAGLVLTPETPPDRLIWPVSGCPCLIEWGAAAPELLIIELVRCLLKAGAVNVTVIPLFIDFSTPAEYYDVTDKKFHKARESIKTYHPHKEVRHAVA
ncbi:MAG: hypothetical protein WCP55_08510 [Lentisphaerota bacterium]